MSTRDTDDRIADTTARDVDVPDTADIAIVGMAARFPGARDIDEYWRNLCDGVESVTYRSKSEVEASLSPEVVADDHFVPAVSSLSDYEMFDAAFFGYQPREAELMDPQHRVLLECAWTALEDAGYRAGRPDLVVGTYVGAAANTYLLFHLSQGHEDAAFDRMQVNLGNADDFLATRISYKLNLTGPSLAVRTACSTSLVAVHLACQALSTGECDVALAGGSTVNVSQASGYRHVAGGILSPDGHCRAFDARAAGTIFGSGVGVVVLKRLSDARAAGDNIVAVIRGSAVNNDGALKAGYTAPSVTGQNEAIAEAYAVAGIPPRTIEYVEAHGTATAIGDPIEIEALTRAFRAQTGDRHFCALGSVKTNIGHLDAAAGIAGLIKAALAVKHGRIPPSLHFSKPNPAIDFATSPFYVNTVLKEWRAGAHPRRAAVSAFGIGGTNAHVVLEEPPPPRAAGARRTVELVLLSARTAHALEASTDRLRGYLQEHPDLDVNDVAYTLQVGRQSLPHRRAIVCRSRAELVDLLADPQRLRTSIVDEQTPAPVAFLFPGHGAHVQMARGLYDHEPFFRTEIDRYCSMLEKHVGRDIRPLLFAPAGDRATAEHELVQTAIAQPALFVVELALAQLLLAWGIRPDMALGHSLGEYVAACVSGVMSTEDALAIVAARGRLMGALPPGGMVAVPLGEDRLAADLGGALAIAAVNAPDACVVSGPLPEIAEFERQMAAKGVRTDRLQTSHAFHSPMMQAAADALARTLSAVRLEPPRIPFVSNVTGTWITAAEATNPAYWARQLVAPTRIADGLARLLDRNAILLEVGPGHVLSTLAELQRTATRSVAVPLMRGARQQDDDVAVLWEGLGRAWLAGAGVDWAEAHSPGARRRVRLPTYPFERQRYWIERTNGASRTGAAASTGEHDAAPVTPRREHRGERSISAALKDVVSQVCGIEPDTIDVDAPFAQLGLNSMLLLQVNQAVHDRFHVDVPLRQYFEECSTISALAAYVEQQAPESGAALHAPSEDAALTTALAPAADGPIPNPPPATSAVEQQLASISRQLDLLLRQSNARIPSGGDAAVPVVPAPNRPVPSSTVPGGASSVPVAEAAAARQPFTPYTRLNLDANAGFARRQREHVEQLIARYTARTARSRAAIESGRRVLANNRTVAGFRLALKEITYPIVVREAAGSKFLDVDGNEYVDISMGFGAYLFGHNAPFINAAVAEELKRGAPIGPFSHEAGHVARRICELTDVERVAFFTTGTEAVMVAVRLARARTGRSKIALFAGSFHGTFDGILARPRLSAGGMGSAPMAPGVPEHMTDQVIVLEYGSQAALEAVAANGHDLAAVLVEPVQSRRPEFQPADFLRQLRDVTRQTGSALIFDEMITGFRIAPGGVQAHFGVRADLVTYGKVVGGGMPIGVVAGASPFMDGIDGGLWTFGDQSYPPNEERRTFVAGTFCQHPLAMSAAAAVLDHLTNEGPALQRGLNERAERLTSRLNAYFSQTGVPLHMVSFGSLFRFVPRGDLELLFYHLVDKGIYIWEGRNCFLSTAHTDDDLDRIVGAVQESVEELREGGFLPPVAEPRPPGPQPEPAASRAVVAAPSGPEPPILAPLTDEQKQLWVLTQLSPEASAAYNEGVALRLHGPIDVEALRWALEQLYRRHEALRTTIEPDGETQRVAPPRPFEVGLVDLTHRSGDDAIGAWLAEEGSRPFDLAAGPLVRAYVLTLGEHDHLFVFVVHHIIADDWSRGVLLEELGTLYSARRAGTSARLPEPVPFRDYIAWQQKQLRDDTAPAVRGRAFWERLFAGAPSRFDLPMDRPRPTARYFPGARLTRTLPSAVAEALAQLAAQRNATPFVVLLSAFAALLGRISQERELLVTVSATGQPMMNASTLVGQCISMLPLPLAADLDRSFAAHLADVRRRLLDVVEHQRGYLAAVVQARQNGVRTPDPTVMFNLDRPVEVTGFDPASAELLPFPGRYAKFDLSLNAIEIDGSVRLEFEYRTDLFDSATVEGWSAQFVALLQRVADAPDADLGDLLVAPETGARAERPGLPAGRADAADLMSIFARRAQRDPNAQAIVAGSAALTYGELDRLASAFAEDLRASGAGPGRIVAVDGDGLAEIAVCLLGVVKAGGAFVQIGERAGGGGRALAGVDTIVVARRGLKPAIEPAGVAARMDRPQRARLQAACAVYGDEEAPLLLSHDAAAAHCRAIANRLRLSPGDRFSHVGESAVDLLEGLLPALLAGATVVDGPSDVPDLETLCEHIEKHRVTALDIPLGPWRRLRRQAGGRDMTPAASSVRCLVRGNVAATALQLERWCPRLFDRSVVSCGYRPGTWPIVIGMTAVSAPDVTGARSFPLVDLIESTATSIRDARMRPTLPGAVGELCLGASADGGTPPHRTGIRARRLFDGRLQLLGALDTPRIVAIDRLTVLDDGEIDEPRLPAGEAEDVDVSHEPRGEVQEQLASIWRRLLNVARIGSRDNFFELGGHSLVAIALAAEVRSAFAVPLTLRELFDAPTIAQMGALIAARRAAPVGPADNAAALVRVAPDPDAADQPFPLTDVQQAYWVGRTGAFGLGNVATHAYYEVDTTDLDLDRFANAWRRLIARHGMLRAVILPDGQQQVLPDVPPYQIATSDLTGLDPDTAAARLAAIRDRMSHQVLPSDRWPLFEIHAARLDAARVRLYFSLDALILDAWSMQILFRELSCLYQDPAAGLPPLEVSFRDYMMAHRELERGAAFRDAQEYWAARRTTLPPAPDLPLARDPASIDKPRFVRWSGRLNAETWAQLKARASRSSMTPSIVLLAAYAEVLAMWSRSPQFAINLTLFNRLPLHSQVNDLVGDFTSVTLLAVDGQAAGSFAERARRVQERFWEDLDHHLVSGVRVLRDLARARNDTTGLQMPVVFTSSLIHGQERVDETPMAWLGRVVYSVTQTPQVWLDHEVYEDGLSLVFTWDVVADLFPDGVVQSMFDAFTTLLERLASGDEWWDAPWPDVHRRLLPATQADVVSRANATEAPVSTALLQTLFADRARTQPERLAIVTSARSLSYGELEQRANRIGRSLRRMGARPNTCVAVMIPKGWEQVVAVLGVLNAGAAYLPIDPALPHERITSLLAQAEVSLVVTAQRTDASFPWPSHIRRIAVDRDDLQDVDSGPLDPVQTSGDLAYVIFTSGSTGEPKGVMIDHRGAVNTILDVNRRYRVGPDDRVLALSSLSFDLSVWDLFGLLAAGGTIVIPDDGATRNPAHWVSLMSRERVTIWNSVPALMQMLVEYSDAAAAFTAGLRLVLMSGDWIPVGLPDRIRALGPDVRLVSLGGATEASIWSILYDIGTVDESWTSIPYGRPMANQAWHVLDGALEPRPVWTPGHLYIGGIGVATGYWRDEARTGASFITHPRTGERLYRTGDVGRWLPDGTIEFLGREDTQVKVQGHRIELGEIESILVQHPSVRSAVVAAVGARTGEKRLIAYVVPESEPGSGEGPVSMKGPSGVAGAIADPIAQLRFKLSEPGLRADRERPGVTLPAVNLGTAALTSAYIERRSYRSFAGERLRLEQIAGLVSCLRQWRVPGAPLPKYRYGSAGSLYAVQLYAYVKPAAVEGLDAGTYYHDPRGHRLLPLTGVVDGFRDIYQPNDRATFDDAGFGLFLVADVGVIERLYAAEATRFALIETGLMTQLLEMSAPECGIGLCQIGRTDFDRVRPLFAVDDRHVLLNALIGGAIRPSQRSVAAFLDEMAGLQPLVAAAQAASERDERPTATTDLRTAWRTWLQRKIPAYMVPTEFMTMEALPLSGNGKVDRKALPVPRESEERPPSGFVAARTDLERQLVDLLQDVLGVERIGVHDSFFELGGNSVHLVQFHNRLEQLIGRKIPITAVFQHVTLSALSEYLAGAGPAAPVDRSQAVATGTQRLTQLLQRRGK